MTSESIEKVKRVSFEESVIDFDEVFKSSSKFTWASWIQDEKKKDLYLYADWSMRLSKIPTDSWHSSSKTLILEPNT